MSYAILYLGRSEPIPDERRCMHGCGSWRWFRQSSKGAGVGDSEGEFEIHFPVVRLATPTIVVGGKKRQDQCEFGYSAAICACTIGLWAVSAIHWIQLLKR